MKDTTESGIHYPFSYQDAVEILKLIQESARCQSLDLSIGDIRLSLTRATQAGANAAPASAIAPRDVTVGDSAKPPAPMAVAKSAQVEGVVEVITPTLGVFYRSPSPGAAPFVKEGDEVSPEDQIGLLEVMKLYMPVTAGVSGRVVQVLAPDGALVEHGQVLMLIETD